MEGAGDEDRSWDGMCVGRRRFPSSPCERCLIALLPSAVNPSLTMGWGGRHGMGHCFWKANVSHSDSKTLDNPVRRSLLKRQ